MKKYVFLQLLIILLIGATGCFAHTRTSAREVDFIDFETIEQADQIAQTTPRQPATTRHQFGQTPQDSIRCIQNWNIYREFFRQRNFELALEPWRWMFLNCPRATENIYIHGVTLVHFMMQRETDAAKREALIDTLMMVFEQRIKYFGREGANVGRQALELKRLRPNSTRDHYDLTERSVVLQGNATDPEVLRVNFFAAKTLVESGIIDPALLVDKYDRASEIIAHNLKSNQADSAAFVATKEQIQSMFDPFASCENLIRIYTSRVEANPQDAELLRRVTTMLDRAGCSDSQLFYLATKNLHHLNPNAQSAFLMGRLYANRDNYASALRYYEQAVALSNNQPGNGIDLFQTHMFIADILFRHMNRLPQARTAALAASEVNPNSGRPHVLIGQMYAQSARSCGTDEISTAAVYWAAVDRFIRARNIDSDPDVIAIANQLISAYSQFFPNNETLFFHGLDGGRPVRAGCWINENTTARARP